MLKSRPSRNESPAAGRSQAAVFRYGESCDQLFGVVAALLGELNDKPR